MKDVTKLVFGYIITGVIMLFSGFILYQLFMSFVYPWISEQFNALNFVVIIMVTALLPMFVVKLLYSTASMKMRVFVLDSKYSVVDSLLPIWSEIKWYSQYISLLSGVYLPEINLVQKSDGTSYVKEDWSNIEASNVVVLFAKLVGKMLIILPVIFYVVLITGGIYIYLTDGHYMIMPSHVIWLCVLLFIYNLSVANKSFAFGLICVSMKDYIVSFNPIKFIISPFIVPVFSFGYFILSLVCGLLFKMDIQQPMFNMIVLIGIPVINPLMSWWNTRLTVNDCKRTINEQRVANGEKPFVW